MILPLTMVAALAQAAPQQAAPQQATPQQPPTNPEPTGTLPTVVVEGRASDLVGVANSSSEGIVGQAEIARRPVQRAGEILETVPGVIVTQHSGIGKSNQQFARGFNLDHGTDLATSLFGLPLNMPSHGHGQGYTDLGLLIPELVDTVRWRLGPYDVRDGDFGSAGAIDITYRPGLDRGFVKVTGGSFDLLRTVAADSYRVAGGELLAAVELQQYDGPFAVDQDYRKRNAYLSWSDDSVRVRAFAYDTSWTATDQIPRRAVQNGQLDRFDSLDPTSGGDTTWFGVVAELGGDQPGDDHVTLFAQHYDFALFSNFTYFLDDPVGGDQFEQRDHRTSYGGRWLRELPLALGGRPGAVTLGAELRGDHIDNGLFRSMARTRTATVRSDRIDQHHATVFADVALEPCDWLRGHAGARYDHYWFDVDSDLAANSGTSDDGILSGKAGLVFGPFARTEAYANLGTGFHSNDARGVLQRDDPGTAQVLDGAPVDALVRSRGAELGLRTSVLDGLQSTLSVWTLDLEQELVFVGDAGSTEPTRASRRYGVEWANHYRPLPWLTFDADLTWARARYRDRDAAGDRVPGAVPMTAAAGVTCDWTDGLSSSLRLRHFDARPLVEDGSVQSSSTTLLNAQLLWDLDDRRQLQLDVFNLLDREASDIEYYYESQLAGEAGPVEDVHFHPVEPLSLRLSFVARF